MKGTSSHNLKLPKLAISLLMMWMVSLVAAEKVVVQLKWEHEFQFAGYYAAQWEGYYQDKGIEAELRSAVTSDKEIINVVDEVISGRADFGIGGLDILTAIDQGEELFILAPLFQKSPTVIVTAGGLVVESIDDLVGLRVGMEDASSSNSEIMSMFRFHGVDPGSINLHSRTPLVKDLSDGILDAIITYGVSAQYQARELGYDINLVETSKFGIHFFGDVLYTRKSFYQENPRLVNDFVEASLKGWEHALNNKSKLVDRISTELPRYLIQYDNIHDYNEFASEYIDQYIQWPEIELGNLNFNQWNQIYNDLRYIGIFESDWNPSNYIWQKVGIDYASLFRYLLIICIVFLMALNFYFYKESKIYRYLMMLVVVAVVSIYFLFEKNIKSHYLQESKFQSLVELESMKSMLTRIMDGNIALLKSFATHISQNPEITLSEYNTYAEQVIEYGRALSHFAAAPDLIIKLVYPLQDNEPIVGFDYTKSNVFLDSVLATTHSDQVVVSGPNNLLQGGDAIIARVAIYENNDRTKFWGVLSAAIDFKLFLSMSGVFQQDSVIKTAIMKTGDDERVVHGNQALFVDENAVSVKFKMGNSNWRMVAKPEDGWDYPSNQLWLWRLIPVVVLNLIFYILYLRNKQEVRNQIYKATLQRNEQLLLEVGELAHIGGWRIDSQGNVTQWTAISEGVLGHYFPTKINHIDEIISLLPNHEAQRVRMSFQTALTEGVPFDLEVKYINQKDQTRWVRIISDEFTRNYEGFEVTGAIQDITYYKNINELIEYQATHDSLTNLLNRNSLIERAHKLIAAQESDYQFMVLFIDIDDFKSINDSLGHHSGDQFLKMVAKTLSKIFSPDGILARYSGDEFVAVMPYQHDGVEHITQQVLDAIRKDYEIEGTHVVCSCSVGVSLYPQHSHSIHDLVSKADMAMYSAKQSGKKCMFCVFASFDGKSRKKSHIKNSITTCID